MTGGCGAVLRGKGKASWLARLVLTFGLRHILPENESIGTLLLHKKQNNENGLAINFTGNGLFFSLKL
ncbi:MAG: hypothetical protein LBH18_00520 [Spirochaetaceae bacterium]|nr:hypothetical protein [Spirochaetaceae bacterium]